MYHLDHILVCLDISDMDESLIRYSDFLVEKLKPQTITFLHVMKTYDIPKEILEAYPHLDKPISGVVEEELREKIDTLLTRKNETKVIIKVSEGLTADTILQYTRKNNISLTLMGKKIGYEGRGGIVRKVISIIPSSVLLISETTYPKIKQVLVRMDFNKMSELALRMAMELRELTGAGITCHHVYKLPLKFFPHNDPEKDPKLLKHVDQFSRKEYKKFLQKYKLNAAEISFSNSLDPESNEANILYKEALTIGADIILLGSKIKSELTNIIIDSTSEKLAATEKNIPVLIVKDRKQTTNFLEALFK